MFVLGIVIGAIAVGIGALFLIGHIIGSLAEGFINKL